jgi:hypothetical protein
MKALLSLFTALALAFTASAGLQVIPLGTNTVAGSSVSNVVTFSQINGNGNGGYLGSELTSVNTKDYNILVGSTSTAADTSLKTFSFNVSADNILWASNAFVMSYASNGTNFANAITNVPDGWRYPYYQLNTVSNANASTSVVATNLTAEAFSKDGIPHHGL